MPKRQEHEIKDAILDALERYPMNTSQLSKKVGTNLDTARRHLEELEDLHVVRRISTPVRGEENEYWEQV